MSKYDQLVTGLELTLTGMVTVFLLLAFMVLVVRWMSKLAHYLQPASRHGVPLSADLSDGQIDPALVSAISAAIHQYRNRHG